ncbi:MAG: ATP phosphoribosyltransferase regulatory subunit, partial [Marinomonas sp.]
AEQVDAVRRELDTKDAGGLKAAGGEAYLPLLYATGTFTDALPKLRAIDAGGALASRIAGLEEIAATLGGDVRITLDPTERHGFEYQSWFGFTLYAEGVLGAVGRGGTYQIAGSEEAASGFTLYADRMARGSSDAATRDTLYLPLSHDRALAAKLRGEGWRTIAALGEAEDPKALGATHILEVNTPKPL